MHLFNFPVKINVSKIACIDVSFGVVPQVQKEPYDQKVDIFSLGMIFLELLMPFSTGMERVTTLQNARKGVFPERFCRELHAEVSAEKTE